MPLFYPTVRKHRITDITADDLRALGVRGLLLDVDNTLTRYKSQELDPAVAAWLQRMQQQGIALTVVSNGLPRRVRPFAQKIGRPDVYRCGGREFERNALHHAGPDRAGTG